MTGLRHSNLDSADASKENPSMNRTSARIATSIVALLAMLAIAVAPAAAKVVHRTQGSFDGSDAPPHRIGRGG